MSIEKSSEKIKQTNLLIFFKNFIWSIYEFRLGCLLLYFFTLSFLYINWFCQGHGQELYQLNHMWSTVDTQYHAVLKFAIAVFKSFYFIKGWYKEGYSVAELVSLVSLSLVREILSIIGYVVL